MAEQDGNLPQEPMPESADTAKDVPVIDVGGTFTLAEWIRDVNQDTSKIEKVIESEMYDGFTSNGKTYFQQTVEEYAKRLSIQSCNIGETLHTGDGDIEITANNVQEAKWVLARRDRQQKPWGIKVILCRAIQTLAAIFASIGGSELFAPADDTLSTGTQGAKMFVVSVIVFCVAVMVEFINKSDS